MDLGYAANSSAQPTWRTLDKQLAIDFYWIASHDQGHRLQAPPGFSSFCDLCPEEKIGVVLLVNRFAPDAQDKLKQISERIITALRQSAPHP